MILTPLEAFISIGMNAVSRHFEWEADRFACELQDKLSSEEMSDMGDRLGRALITLHVKNLSTVWVDWLCVYISSFTPPIPISRFPSLYFSHIILRALMSSFVIQVLGIPPLAPDLDRATEGSRGLQGQPGEEEAVELYLRCIYHIDFKYADCAVLSIVQKLSFRVESIACWLATILICFDSSFQGWRRT